MWVNDNELAGLYPSRVEVARVRLDALVKSDTVRSGRKLVGRR